MEHGGSDRLPGSTLFTHCHRELFHAQWKDLLDDEFLQAYKHRMVFVCGDNVKRRLFPRIFTYSADYPEKWVCIISFTLSAEEALTIEFSLLISATLAGVHALDVLFRKLSFRMLRPRMTCCSVTFWLGAIQQKDVRRSFCWI